ncbi:MAG TPA: cytochrome c [Thermodesulfobacteriota bacterium]|nr:cytochrome c [Thermodesulfobacteriota bacterium]
MPKVYFVLIGLLIFLSFTLAWGNGMLAQEVQETDLSGKELFIQNRCVRCHTIGRGRFVGPDLAGVGERYGQDEIERWIENPQQIYQVRGKSPVNEGYPPMPPLGVSSSDAEKIADYLLSVKTSIAQNEEGGVIKGKVINETKEEAVEGVELTLTSFMGDRATDEKKTKTNIDGFFEFKELSWNRSYAISVNYNGAEYVTDKMVFYPEEDAKTLDLPIYEPTDSDENISVNAAHMIVQITEEKIAVAEMMVLHNGSRRIYIGKDELQNGRREVLRFDLPEGANEVEFLSGLTKDSVVRTDKGFSDTSSVAPGISRIVYAYTLPYGLGSNVFEKTISYPTQGFILLVSDSGRNVKVEGLSGGDTVQIQNGKFLRWTGENLKADTKIKVEISSPLLGGDILQWVVLGAIVMLVGGSIFYSVVKRNKPVEKHSAKHLIDDLKEQREILIREIAELDDKFEAGEISEGEYRKERSQKKEKLLDVARRAKGIES